MSTSISTAIIEGSAASASPSPSTWIIKIDNTPPETDYLAAINEANRAFMGGADNAGAAGEPIQFLYGLNTCLHIPTGREDARRIVAYLQGLFSREEYRYPNVSFIVIEAGEIFRD